MRRRDLLKGAVLLPAALGASADVPGHLWQGYNFGAGPPLQERLNQGPFDIDQDQGWQTVPVHDALRAASPQPGPWLGRLCLGGERSVAGGPGGSGNDRAARREDFELCALLRSFSRRRAASEIIPACSGSGRQSGRTQQCCGMLQIYGSVPVGPQD
jgi:hypothetical protein